MERPILWILAALFCGAPAAPAAPFDHDDLRSGDATWRRKGVHSGNKVRTVFYNFGLVANLNEISGEWPIGTGNYYIGDVTPVVGVEYVNALGDTVHSVVTCDGPRGNSDGPGGGVFWGLEPIPDFLNEAQDGVAMSHLPGTWPAHWPDRAGSWDGFWNGFFGRGVQNADQESFFYMDDAADAEFNSADDGTTLWLPDPSQPERDGLGLVMRVRGFQWSHFLAEDVIFWLYEVTNISVHDYDRVAFGMVVGTLSGGRDDANDDLAFFDLEDDITYSWDFDDIGSPGWVPVSETINVGYVGYAFLESPGNPFNGIDDDGDGEEGSPLIDRGMLSGEITGNGIDDNENGLIDEGEQHIGLGYADGVDNDADGDTDEMIDERRDDGIDNDSDWDPLLHDTGADGVAGTGDEGEGDGIPTAGERNFDATDVDESDQIGLTSFDYFAPSNVVKMNDDEGLWERLEPGRFDVVPGRPEDGDFIYGSGLFPLKSGQTQRFSMALVFGEDFEDIVENKRTAQKIYDDNYNFARPPANPTVWAAADSGKVTLYWNGEDSENSFDDVLGYDFEGYKIYKSTEPFFNESFTITDAKGRKTFNDPLAQFDKVDGKFGFFEVPIEGRGIQFFLGNESGLRYTYEDTDVTNGRTYYYAVVAYDHGSVDKNMQPAENTKSITELESGVFIFDDNTVAATPGVRAGGYRGPQVGDWQHEGGATGSLAVEVVDPTQVLDRRYQISFQDSTYWSGDTLFARATTSYSVRDLDTDSLVVDSSPKVQGGPSDDFFAGMRVVLDNQTRIEVIDSLSQWSGAAAATYEVSLRVFNFRRTQGHEWPGVYELRVTDQISGRSTYFEIDDIIGTIPVPEQDTRFDVVATTAGLEQPVEFAFWEPTNPDGALSPGDQIILLQTDPDDSETTLATWAMVIEEGGGEPPGDGARYTATTTVPFRGGADGDLFEFSALPASASGGPDSSYDMARIKVVPNPYVAGNALEPRQLFSNERGERRLLFTHLPPRATIRVYTLRGELVDTIKHDGGDALDGTATWDLRSRDNLEIAYGVYLYHVDAPGYGVQSGKFAVIK